MAVIPAWIASLVFRSIAIITHALLLQAAAGAPDASVTSPSRSQPRLAAQYYSGAPAASHSNPNEERERFDQLMMEELSKLLESSRVNVYVYDDPALDFSDVIDCYREKYGESPWQDERADMAQDMGEIWLHRAMLDHPWRVLEPDQADVFYVPMYPVLSYKLMRGPGAKKCRGLTHNERITNAVAYLHTRSVYFQRFGGSDHVIVCAWWNCHSVFTPWQRTPLRRAVLGINERNTGWAKWGCGGRLLTIPYTASSIITTPELFGGADPESRDIPFFFVGTARKRPERENLKVGPAHACQRTLFFSSSVSCMMSTCHDGRGEYTHDMYVEFKESLFLYTVKIVYTRVMFSFLFLCNIYYVLRVSRCY